MSPRDRARGAADAADDALDRALDRWRRARPSGRPARPESVSPEELAELTRRLDDSGCAFGRVSAARLEHLTRAYDRLETKLNAVLMAVCGTFLSTLASLLLYYIRGTGH
jgi:hypothetical protein